MGGDVKSAAWIDLLENRLKLAEQLRGQFPADFDIAECMARIFERESIEYVFFPEPPSSNSFKIETAFPDFECKVMVEDRKLALIFRTPAVIDRSHNDFLQEFIERSNRWEKSGQFFSYTKENPSGGSLQGLGYAAEMDYGVSSNLRLPLVENALQRALEIANLYGGVLDSLQAGEDPGAVLKSIQQKTAGLPSAEDENQRMLSDRIMKGAAKAELMLSGEIIGEGAEVSGSVLDTHSFRFIVGQTIRSELFSVVELQEKLPQDHFEDVDLFILMSGQPVTLLPSARTIFYRRSVFLAGCEPLVEPEWVASFLMDAFQKAEKALLGASLAAEGVPWQDAVDAVDYTPIAEIREMVAKAREANRQPPPTVVETEIIEEKEIVTKTEPEPKPKPEPIPTPVSEAEITPVDSRVEGPSPVTAEPAPINEQEPVEIQVAETVIKPAVKAESQPRQERIEKQKAAILAATQRQAAVQIALLEIRADFERMEASRVLAEEQAESNRKAGEQEAEQLSKSLLEFHEAVSSELGVRHKKLSARLVVEHGVEPLELPPGYHENRQGTAFENYHNAQSQARSDLDILEQAIESAQDMGADEPVLKKFTVPVALVAILIIIFLVIAGLNDSSKTSAYLVMALGTVMIAGSILYFLSMRKS